MERIVSLDDLNRELKELSLKFLQNLNHRLVEIEGEIESEHWEQIAQHAHRLSGAAGSYGFSNLAMESRNLESQALSKNREAIQKSIRTIQNLSQQLTETEIPEGLRQ